MSAPLALGRSMVGPKLIPTRGEDMPYPPPPAARFDENEDLSEAVDDVNEMNSSSEEDEEYQDPRPFQQVTQDGVKGRIRSCGFSSYFYLYE